jgi:hypothetical protein
VRGLFSCTLFLSAALLFLVQPLVARLVLPRLGGTPAVWNTCMLFFQSALLAGYAYAHALPSWLGVRRHAVLHLAILLLPLLVLPITVPADWSPPSDGNPIGWLLMLLLLVVGLPFFAVATAAPLLQRWFAATRDPAAGDPYFLYAASNLGSMIGLFAYPFVLEPNFRLADQGRIWTLGYLLLLLLTALCAGVVWRSPPAGELPRRGTLRLSVAPVTAARRGLWLALAFVPSSLMLSVTTYLTTDIAAVPLLWVVPLALYLMTFVLAFARRNLVPFELLARGMPLMLIVGMLLLLTGVNDPPGVVVVLHLLLLFWVGLVCHGRLAQDRPDPACLTEFYLITSIGGALGGLFNALVAPLIFASIAEYPLVLAMAGLLLPTRAGDSLRQRDLLLPVAVGLLTLLLIALGRWLAVGGQAGVALAFALPLVVCYVLHERPLRFGLALAAVLLAGSQFQGVHGRAEFRLRSFYGAHRVSLDPSGGFRILWHGNTVHGQQSLDPARADEPLNYYHRTGPIGRLLTALRDDPRLERVGLVGLGAGALATYSQSGQRWTFFEIDPAVLHIARDSRLFTFLQHARGEIDYVLGDARLRLAEPGDRFGLLIVDAFSSDAIPVHLLTREALRTYRDRLQPDGLLAFNISNRYLNLRSVLANLARDAGLRCFVRDDLSPSAEERAAGKSPSVWAVLTASSSDAANLRRAGWDELRGDPRQPVWTDDFSNLLGVFDWGGGGD